MATQQAPAAGTAQPEGKLTAAEQIERTLVAALTLAAFVLRLWAIESKGLAYDEAATALMSRALPSEIVWFHWTAAFEHLPLWVLLMRGWSLVAGQSEFALRFVPALAGTAMVPLTWTLCLRLPYPGARWCVLTALFVATAPVLVYYSQEARMYTLVVLFALVSTHLLLHALGGARWAWPTFVLANWIMLGIQYYSTVFISAQALVVLIALLNARARALRDWLIPAAAFALSGAPFLLWAAYSPGFRETLDVTLDNAEQTALPPYVVARELWRNLAFGAFRWPPPNASLGLLVLVPVAVGLLEPVWRSSNEGRCRPYALLPILLALAPLLVSLALLPNAAARYLLFVSPFLYMLAALGADRLWRITPVLGLAGIACVAIASGSGLNAYYGSYQKSDYRAAARFLNARFDPQRDLTLLEGPRQHLLARYYLDPDIEFRPVPEIDLPAYWPVTAPPVVPEELDDQVQLALRRHESLWVLYAGESEVDRGELLARYLSAVSYQADCERWIDVRLCRYISRDFVQPDLSATWYARFAEELQLTSSYLSFSPPRTEPDETLILIRLDWHALVDPSLDLKVTLRLVADDGQAVAQVDEFPIGPLLPPTTWREGDRKPGFLALPIPRGLAPGRYRILASLYDPTTLQPAPYRIGPSGADATEPLLLAYLEVDDTMRLTDLD